MAKRKKFKKAVRKKPSWVGDIDLSNCEDGLVYNIYQCKKCILEYKQDHARKKRKKFILLPGKKKKELLEICLCDPPTTLLIKYKRCPCDEEYWGFYLREKQTCKICGAYSDLIKTTDYYRLLEFYMQTEQDLSDPNRWDCINRRICLESTFEKGSRRGIACLDCPYYDKAQMS